MAITHIAEEITVSQNASKIVALLLRASIRLKGD
jgi:hypothetical protein